jgi:formamidopyrimidine-DNA glycosylase
MPELPDITVYIESLHRFFGGRPLNSLVIRSPLLLRTFDPPVSSVTGLTVQGFRRMGKRIVWEMEGGLFLVFHLMVAGRYHLRKPGSKPRSRNDLAAFHFSDHTVMLTEAATRKRAALHVVIGEEALKMHEPGGIDVLEGSLAAFSDRLTAENHTLKRALTDPSLFSGIGNAYSDEILHAAALSPIQWTQRLSRDQIDRLYVVVQRVLTDWTNALRVQNSNGFPERVTAFRSEMAVHGKYGLPCPVCRTSVQRIVYTSQETNYCPRCQTGGKVLADRALSRLLKGDWPKTVDDLESFKYTTGQGR